MIQMCGVALKESTLNPYGTADGRSVCAGDRAFPQDETAVF